MEMMQDYSAGVDDLKLALKEAKRLHLGQAEENRLNIEIGKMDKKHNEQIKIQIKMEKQADGRLADGRWQTAGGYVKKDVVAEYEEASETVTSLTAKIEAEEGISQDRLPQGGSMSDYDICEGAELTLCPADSTKDKENLCPPDSTKAQEEKEVARLRRQVQHLKGEQAGMAHELLVKEQAEQHWKKVAESAQLHSNRRLAAHEAITSVWQQEIRRKESLWQEELRTMQGDQKATQALLREKEQRLTLQEEETLRLRGDRDALQTLSLAQLEELTHCLTGALAQAQREQRRRCESQAEQLICIVCLVERRSTVLQPCGHAVLCNTCSTRCGTKCPQCRSVITARSRIYF